MIQLKGFDDMDKHFEEIARKAAGTLPGNPAERQERLRGYIKRLSDGEPLDAVRRDFVEQFSSVSPGEIAMAEQSLIKSGVPLKEVQRLCDVHSALFHGKTEQELIESRLAAASEESTSTGYSALPAGHPISIMLAENKGLVDFLDELENTASNPSRCAAVFPRIMALFSHYAKKEELLMPALYSYGVTGPSQVMWGTDDEIKRELRTIRSALKDDAGNAVIYNGRIRDVAKRIREMAYKEEKILFPLCLRFFSDAEWFMIYGDMNEMGCAFISDLPSWKEAEQYLNDKKAARLKDAPDDGILHLPTGNLTVKQLRCMLKLLPIDITFIDDADIFQFFVNEGHVFARPHSALGREVWNCHPPEILPVVHNLVEDFKAHKRSDMEVYRWIKGRPVGVHYMAVYDEDDHYIGTMEIVQDFTNALSHFGGK